MSKNTPSPQDAPIAGASVTMDLGDALLKGLAGITGLSLYPAITRPASTVLLNNITEDKDRANKLLDTYRSKGVHIELDPQLRNNAFAMMTAKYGKPVMITGPDMAVKPGVMAHELGHLQDFWGKEFDLKKKTAWEEFATMGRDNIAFRNNLANESRTYGPIAALLFGIAKGGKAGLAVGAIGAAGSIPQLYTEARGSTLGAGIMKDHGYSTLESLEAFSGMPTYLAASALPLAPGAAIYGMEKIMEADKGAKGLTPGVVAGITGGTSKVLKALTKFAAQQPSDSSSAANVNPLVGGALATATTVGVNIGSELAIPALAGKNKSGVKALKANYGEFVPIIHSAPGLPVPKHSAMYLPTPTRLAPDKNTRGTVLLTGRYKNSESVLAHELGHAMDEWKTPNIKSYTNDTLAVNRLKELKLPQAHLLGRVGPLAAAAGGMFASNDEQRAWAGHAGALAAVPMLRKEFAASINGANILKNIGRTGPARFRTFAGLPSYLTFAGLGYTPWLASKINQSLNKRDQAPQ